MIYIYTNKPYTCRIKYRHIASYTNMKWMQLASELLASTISKKGAILQSRSTEVASGSKRVGALSPGDTHCATSQLAVVPMGQWEN